MQNLLVSFFVGFISTFSVFALSALIVIGAKALQIYLENFIPQEQQEQAPPPAPKPKPRPKPTPRKKPQQAKTPSGVIKSIEIDPKEIDRIYVKRW